MRFTTDRRNRSRTLAAAALLAALAVGGAAGCSGRAAIAPDAGATAPHTPSTPAATPSTSAATATASATPIAGTSASSTGAAAAPNAPAAAIEDCGQGPKLTRPTELELTCADAGMWAKNLTWSSWSRTGATATATLTWNNCTPNCADSTSWSSTSAQITLIDPVLEPGNQVLFTQLVLHVTGPTPAGFQRNATFNMAPN